LGKNKKAINTRQCAHVEFEFVTPERLALFEKHVGRKGDVQLEPVGGFELEFPSAHGNRVAHCAIGGELDFLCFAGALDAHNHTVGHDGTRSHFACTCVQFVQTQLIFSRHSGQMGRR
jgi:hypothetical protein